MTIKDQSLPINMNTTGLPAGYGDFLLEIKTQIRQRQFQALRAANRELLQLYWWLGENISRRQVEQGWGKSVVENLARDLQEEFPGRNGFSARNLWNMLDFFRAYSEQTKLQPLVAEISWANLGTRAANGAIIKYAKQCVAYWIFLFRQFSPQRGENCSAQPRQVFSLFKNNELSSKNNMQNLHIANSSNTFTRFNTNWTCVIQRAGA